MLYPETLVDDDGVVGAAADLLDGHAGHGGNLKLKTFQLFVKTK